MVTYIHITPARTPSGKQPRSLICDACKEEAPNGMSTVVCDCGTKFVFCDGDGGGARAYACLDAHKKACSGGGNVGA